MRGLVLAGLLALGAAGAVPPRPATAQERLTDEQILRLQALRAAALEAGSEAPGLGGTQGDVEHARHMGWCRRALLGQSLGTPAFRQEGGG